MHNDYYYRLTTEHITAYIQNLDEYNCVINTTKFKCRGAEVCGNAQDIYFKTHEKPQTEYNQHFSP